MLPRIATALYGRHRSAGSHRADHLADVATIPPHNWEDEACSVVAGNPRIGRPSEVVALENWIGIHCATIGSCHIEEYAIRTYITGVVIHDGNVGDGHHTLTATASRDANKGMHLDGAFQYIIYDGKSGTTAR